MSDIKYFYLCQEVEMWRERYLENKKISKEVRLYFLSTPSGTMFDKKPESTLEMCRYVENQKKKKKELNE